MFVQDKQNHRGGFTLVELLIAIAVIGILAGMLSYALIPAWSRAKEFTIQQEMNQLEQALEQFKIKYGFYPPSFVRIQNPGDVNSDGSINDLDRVAALLPYINRIAPNHGEDAGTVGSRPIDLWWAAVGSNIGFAEGDDLVFWLSGLTKNQQFPLTGNGTATPVAYDDGSFEREIFFEFKQAQLVLEAGGVAHYNQPQGKEFPYLYIDHESYGWGPTLTTPIWYDGYSAGPNGAGGVLYENPDTFQLVTFGLDGLPGAPAIPTGTVDAGVIGNWTHWLATGPAADDNICNFAQGRLEKVKNGVMQSTSN